MSLLTEAMRQTDERIITAFKRENGKWSGVEMVNHPPPSGGERWMPTYSDNWEWPDEETAIKEFKAALPPPQDLKAMMTK
jgi:hypothetical protein